jgi:cell division protein YceG involved in septum cleavage
MGDNGDDFVSNLEEPTTNRDKSTLPEGWRAKRTLPSSKGLNAAFGCTLRFSPRHRTLCAPFSPVGIFERF